MPASSTAQPFNYNAIAGEYDAHRRGRGPFLPALVRLAEASEAARVLEGHDDVYSQVPAHRRLGQLLGGARFWLRVRGDADMAELLYRRALRLALRVAGEDARQNPMARLGLAEVARSRGECTEVIGEFE